MANDGLIDLTRRFPRRLAALGTDRPHVIGDIDAALDSVRALGLPDAAVAGILGDTAARLFPRLGRSARQEAPGDLDA